MRRRRRKRKLNIVAPACYPSNIETEAGGWRIRSRSGLCCKTLPERKEREGTGMDTAPWVHARLGYHPSSCPCKAEPSETMLFSQIILGVLT